MESNREFDVNYIDASGACCFHRCEARYCFNRLMGLQSVDASRIALDFGSAIHAAIPFTYHQETIDQAMTVFSRVWNTFNHGAGDEKRNIFRAGEMLQDALRVHRSDICPYTPLDPPDAVKEIKGLNNYKEVSSKEIPIMFDFGGPFPSTGVIDRAIRWKSTGDLWVLDYKTTSEISPRFFNNFEFCVAACNYTLGYALLTGNLIRGLVIEALRVSKTTTETTLHEIYIQEHMLEKFIKWFKKVSRSIVSTNKAKEWLEEPAGCAPYSQFGIVGYPCPYMLLCQIPNWQDGAKFFVVEHWHPFLLNGEKDS